MSHEILKPCPFCNGEAEIERESTHTRSAIITCSNCGCTIEHSETWLAEKHWNTRFEVTVGKWETE